MTTKCDILIFKWSTETKFSLQRKNYIKIDTIFSSFFKIDSIIFRMFWPFHDSHYYTILPSKKQTYCSFYNCFIYNKMYLMDLSSLFGPSPYSPRFMVCVIITFLVKKITFLVYLLEARETFYGKNGWLHYIVEVKI